MNKIKMIVLTTITAAALVISCNSTTMPTQETIVVKSDTTYPRTEYYESDYLLINGRPANFPVNFSVRVYNNDSILFILGKIDSVILPLEKDEKNTKVSYHKGDSTIHIERIKLYHFNKVSKESGIDCTIKYTNGVLEYVDYLKRSPGFYPTNTLMALRPKLVKTEK